MPSFSPNSHPLASEINLIVTGFESASFDSLALKLFQFQIEKNLPYQRYVHSLGLHKTDIEHWTEIPSVPTRAFKQHRFPLTCFPDHAPAASFHTSGTTTEIKGIHSLPCTDLYELSIRETLRKAALPTLDQLHFLTPSPQEAPHSSLSHMFGTLARENSSFLLVDSKFQLGPLYQTEVPIFLMGTALAFLHLIESHHSIPLPPGSHLLETGGYKGTSRALEKEEFYQQLTDFFQVSPSHIHNEYGMTELSTQAYATGPAGKHQFPPWCRTRVICPESGRELPAGSPGYLCIHDIANAYTVAGIQTQDLAIADHDGSFQLLGRDPSALPRGCSRSADDILTLTTPSNSSTYSKKSAPPQRPTLEVQDRLALISEASEVFTPYTGDFDYPLLINWYQSELENRSARPLLPDTIVHILSSNTPHAAYQTLLRGLVLGSINRLKLPSQGLDDFEESLPVALQPYIETSRTLPDHWIPEADALVVYGTDSTIRHFRSLSPLEIPFLGHGHRAGIAIIHSPTPEAARLATQDIALFDQQGCLSLQTIYLEDPASFAPLLADALAKFETEHPRGPLSLSEHGSITNLRQEIAYLSAQEPEKYSMWHSDNTTSWTIIQENTPSLTLSPGHRTVILKPLSTFRNERFISGIALHPFTPRTDLPSPRIFPLGQAQSPPTLWHHDGLPPLASLVKFQDQA